MAMSRKHYRETAAIIKEQMDRAEFLPESGGAVRMTAADIAGELAVMFRRDNPAFDRNRFMDACGLGDPNGN